MDHLVNMFIYSTKFRCSIHWDPKKEIFNGNIEANKLLSRPQRFPYGTNYVATKKNSI